MPTEQSGEPERDSRGLFAPLINVDSPPGYLERFFWAAQSMVWRSESPLSNPCQSCRKNATAPSSRLWRSVVIAIFVWCCLVVLASALGGFLSFYTGKADELPKWNGWSYLSFSVKEGAVIGAVFTWPLAVIALVVSFIASRSANAS